MLKKLKIKSFTIIEILITIMVVSILSIGVMGGYKFFQDELINQSLKKKILLIKGQMENVFNLRLNNFVLSSGVWSYALDGNITVMYDIDRLQPIYDPNETNFTENDYGAFWSISAKDLKDFANKPFDIVIENKYFTHYTKFPYKNIFILSWGKLNSYPSWNNSLKELFIYKENNESWVFKTFSEMDETSKATLKAWANSKGLNESIFNKEINYIQATNLNIMKEKVETTIKRFNNIIDNIEYWVDAKIKQNDGTGAMPGKNYFMWYKAETETPEDSDLKENFLVDTNATLFIEKNMIEILVDDGGTNPILTDENLTNIFAIVNTDLPNDGAYERYTSTKGKSLSCEFSYYGSTIQLINVVPISSLTQNELLNCSMNQNAAPFIGTQKMMGLISEFDGKEDFNGFPIILSNVDESSIQLIDNEYATDAGSQIPFDGKEFNNNVPTMSILATSSLNVLQNNPPYSISLMIVFPWIIEADDDSYTTSTSEREFSLSNYGWYKKEVFSVTNGL